MVISATRLGIFFAPCSIRDNHKYFREKILTPDLKPEDENARLALEDPQYYEKWSSLMRRFIKQPKAGGETGWPKSLKKQNREKKP